MSGADQAQVLAAIALLKKVDPPARVKKPRRHSVELKYFTEQELESLFRAVDSVRDRAILRIAYHRGLRASEIGAIQLSDWLQRDDRIIIRRLKGSAGGEYHLTSNEVRALRAWLKVRGSDPGPLFLSREGRPISRQMLDVLMKRYGRKAGLDLGKCHMHALKHSCATHLLNRGESLEDAKDHLGHRSIKSTEVYAQFTHKRRHERDRRLRDW